MGQLPKDEIFKPRLVVFLNYKLYRAQAKSDKTLPEWPPLPCILCILRGRQSGGNAAFLNKDVYSEELRLA